MELFIGEEPRLETPAEILSALEVINSLGQVLDKEYKEKNLLMPKPGKNMLKSCLQKTDLYPAQLLKDIPLLPDGETM